MKFKEIEDKVYDACEETKPDSHYCENLSQGKPCKEIDTCQNYKNSVEAELALKNKKNTIPKLKHTPEPIGYIHD